MQETRDFSEIDVEFLNGPPARLPGSVWLNSWRDGKSDGVTLLPPPNKTTSNGNGYGTYTISWTPTVILWYVNGRLVQRSTRAIPNKPSYATFSIWTSTPPHGNGNFGGVLPKPGGAATYRSWFAAHRRVLCERFPLVPRRVVPTPH
jgi:beta-glucanase (GH16 family)